MLFLLVGNGFLSKSTAVRGGCGARRGDDSACVVGFLAEQGVVMVQGGDRGEWTGYAAARSR